MTLRIMDFIKDSYSYAVYNQRRSPQQQWSCCYKASACRISSSILLDFPFYFKSFIKHMKTQVLSNSYHKTTFNSFCLIKDPRLKQQQKSIIVVLIWESVCFFFLFRTESSHKVGPRQYSGGFQVLFLFIHVSCAPMMLQSCSTFADGAITTNHSRNGECYQLKNHVKLFALLVAG